mmetsp:Transcript_144094/g.461277  ORF Transcript_144094/g.461277 Transcript_144094/m.461277 type:complete len:206 (+) Transcript_144094:697-1314(+)
MGDSRELQRQYLTSGSSNRHSTLYAQSPLSGSTAAGSAAPSGAAPFAPASAAAAASAARVGEAPRASEAWVASVASPSGMPDDAIPHPQQTRSISKMASSTCWPVIGLSCIDLSAGGCTDAGSADAVVAEASSSFSRILKQCSLSFAPHSTDRCTAKRLHSRCAQAGTMPPRSSCWQMASSRPGPGPGPPAATAPEASAPRGRNK